MINVKIIKKERNICMTNSNFYANIEVNAHEGPTFVNINGSRTNEDRAFLDNQSIFIVGEVSR